MNGFSEFMTYSLTAVFVQNVILCGTADASLTLLALRRPKKLVAMSGLISLFSLFSTLTIYPIDRFLSAGWLDYMPLRGALLTASALLWYLAAGGIMRKIDSLRRSLGEYIAPAAINGAVLTAPLLLGTGELPGVWGAVGMAAAAGAGFALAAWLINLGMRRMNSPSLPKWFQGAPVMLVYIGLLSMLFSAFGG